MKTKDKILEVAFQVFINYGYHHTSMQQLVEASSLSKGAFYHHFNSKSELYQEVIERYFLSFYRSVDWERFEKANLTLSEIENEIRGFYWSFVPQITALTTEGMSRYYIMYFEAYSLLADFKTTVRDFYNRLKQLIIQAPDNTKEAQKKATQMIATYEGLLFLLAIHPEQNIEILLEEISE
ncbi:TetR/AcrR family transcriptional regulator [Jiulongibacter sediminis]|jgi:AcrR family transcriptional regulator|uniref:TetR/AcrR family transcriptional regulator n=1 Tax=Jiulongibacter sediminis TaxID=1605367 RepID=UPI0026EAF98B|nr:TetR/AcrR family transcriptional regulator [Jiulongibacter sediminis]